MSMSLSRVVLRPCMKQCAASSWPAAASAMSALATCTVYSVGKYAEEVPSIRRTIVGSRFHAVASGSVGRYRPGRKEGSASGSDRELPVLFFRDIHVLNPVYAALGVGQGARVRFFHAYFGPRTPR